MSFRESGHNYEEEFAKDFQFDNSSEAPEKKSAGLEKYVGKVVQIKDSWDMKREGIENGEAMVEWVRDGKLYVRSFHSHDSDPSRIHEVHEEDVILKEETNH